MKSTFENLFDKDEFASIHHENIQKLSIEVFKALNGEKLSNSERNFSCHG